MDKARLLAVRLPEDDVEVPGVGTVRVRGITRDEMWKLRALDTSEPGSFERQLLAFAMLDPVLTVEDVATWQRGARPGELAEVVDRVNDLSALEKDAAKSAYKEFESDPDAEFRAPTSPGSGDDSGPAPGRDVG